MSEIFGYIVLGILGIIGGQIIIAVGASIAISVKSMGIKILSGLLAVVGWFMTVFIPIWFLLKIVFAIIEAVK